MPAADTGIGGTPPPIRATLLGDVRVDVGARAIRDDVWPLRSARSLLLLLLLTRGHAMPKERVLDILWPEASPDVGRNALYKALHVLRRVLEPELTRGISSAYIDTRGGTIGFKPGVAIWVDADACEAALRQAALADADERRSRLRHAVGLYSGELLPADPYEDWPAARREALQRAWEGAVLDLAALDLDANEPRASAPPLELLLAFDLTVEAAHRALMRANAATGQRDRALRQYARCVAALESELGIEPDQETNALHAAILAAAAPPVLQPDVVATRVNNLPAPPTPIVERDRETELIQGMLWRQDVRLVTLTGPGGVGKTRLALEAASGLVDDFANGVAFVPLATVRDPRLVLQAIARTLDVTEVPNQSLAATLRDSLRGRELLLVLDNVEHLLDAAADVGDLLAACAGLTVLVTSRERLRLRGEHVHEVPPLTVPHPDRLPAPASLARFGAAALFRLHLRALHPGFEITRENRDVIAMICSHLEGLPLAIELAAARSRFLTLPELRDGLASRLDLLQKGPRDLPARQRALRETFAWSNDLLTSEEQTVFRRLAVFVGGSTPATADAVCGTPGSQPSSAMHLRSLAEKHLLSWIETAAEPRFSMLETIREYATERLRQSGEEVDVRQRHAVHFLNLATGAEPHLAGSDQLAWFERLDTEQDNIRAALDWALDQPDAVRMLAVRGAVSLWRFWWNRGLLSEGITWLERVTARAGTEPDVRARALLAMADLVEAQSDYDRATALHREAFALFQEAGQRRESASSLNNLATVAYYQGDVHGATSLWEATLAIVREVGDFWAAGMVLGNMGEAEMMRGDFGRAVTLHQENLAVARRLKDPGAIGRALTNLSEAMVMRGDGDQDTLLDEALAQLRKADDKPGEASALTFLGNSAFHRGETLQAAHLYAESLALCQQIGDRTTLADVALLERIAALAAASAQRHEAARVLGASNALREELGAPLMPYLCPIRDRCLEQIRSGLGETAAVAALAEGRLLQPDVAMREALAVCHRAA